MEESVARTIIRVDPYEADKSVGHVRRLALIAVRTRDAGTGACMMRPRHYEMFLADPASVETASTSVERVRHQFQNTR